VQGLLFTWNVNLFQNLKVEGNFIKITNELDPPLLGIVCTVYCTLGEVDFWIFWIFNFLQFTIDWKNNCETKVEKVFLFHVLHVFLCGNEFFNLKNDKIGSKIFFLEIGRYGVQKVRNFTLNSKWN
jgi:hypothetical protein